VTVYLVRHAKAGDREEWDGDDALRPLSKPGRRQAAGLVELLAPTGIRRLVSSSAVRCVQTLEPLGEALGIAVELDDALYEGTGPRPTMDLILQADGDTVALCTHGDVIQDVMDEVFTSGTQPPGEVGLAKGSTWVLETDGSAVVAARYLPPP
jgi:broad specificity phosphatase PhoE